MCSYWWPFSRMQKAHHDTQISLTESSKQTGRAWKHLHWSFCLGFLPHERVPRWRLPNGVGFFWNFLFLTLVLGLHKGQFLLERERSCVETHLLLSILLLSDVVNSDHPLSSDHSKKHCLTNTICFSLQPPLKTVTSLNKEARLLKFYFS